MTTPARPRPPASLVLAASLSAAAAVSVLAMAGAALAAGDGPLGVGVAGFLLVWGLLVAAASFFLLRAHPWARGPVVAAALIHLASMVSFASHQPWAWLGALIALVTVAASVWPTTTRALHLDGR